MVALTDVLKAVSRVDPMETEMVEPMVVLLDALKVGPMVVQMDVLTVDQMVARTEHVKAV